MSPVFIIFIVFIAAALIFHFISLVTNTTQKKKENLCLRLSREGTVNNLTFCSQEILQDKVIGIDGIHRKIMILEKKKDGYYSSIISLDEVHDCQLVTSQGLINNSNFKRVAGINHPATLELQFEFNNHIQTASIIFSNGIANSKKEFAFLKAKAEYWCIMFSKMLSPRMEVRA